MMRAYQRTAEPHKLSSIGATPMPATPVLRLDERGKQMAVRHLAEGQFGRLNVACEPNEFERFMREPWNRKWVKATS